MLSLDRIWHKVRLYSHSLYFRIAKKKKKHTNVNKHFPSVFVQKLLILWLFLGSFSSVLLLTVNLCVLIVTSELVMLSLDLVKTRLSVMSMEMRKNFIQVILTSLIEKSPDPKILRAVVKIVEEWVKNNSPMAANQVRRSEQVQRSFR